MKRTTIEFSDKMTDMIEDLKGFGDTKSFSEVVRNAIGLFHIAKTEENKGNRLAIVNEKGKIVKEIYMGV